MLCPKNRWLQKGKKVKYIEWCSTWKKHVCNCVCDSDSESVCDSDGYNVCDSDSVCDSGLTKYKY